MKKSVDNGSFYSFPNQPAYAEMKPGIYYPAWSDSHGFILVQNKVKSKDLKKELKNESNQSQEWEMETRLQPAVSDNIPKLPSSNGTETEVLNKPFVSDDYFPMEEYNPGLKKVEEGIQFFLNRKDFFTKNGLDYKRSILFFGPPGTGKTWFIRNLSERMVESHDAIVVRIDTAQNLEYLHQGLNDLTRVIADRTKIVVIEELAEFCKDSHYRTLVLQLLDSTYFRDNVLFMVTTNEPDVIPMNLIDRPSRLDVLAKVDGTENAEGFVQAWYTHITGKEFPKHEMYADWYQQAVDRLSPVYWAELFKFSELHQRSLSESWEEIQRRLSLIRNNFNEDSSVGFRK